VFQGEILDAALANVNQGSIGTNSYRFLEFVRHNLDSAKVDSITARNKDVWRDAVAKLERNADCVDALGELMPDYQADNRLTPALIRLSNTIFKHHKNDLSYKELCYSKIGLDTESVLNSIAQFTLEEWPGFDIAVLLKALVTNQRLAQEDKIVQVLEGHTLSKERFIAICGEEEEFRTVKDYLNRINEDRFNQLQDAAACSLGCSGYAELTVKDAFDINNSLRSISEYLGEQGDNRENIDELNCY
jgi:hypothetical protein